MKRTMKDFAERTRATAKYDKGARDFVMFADDADLVEYMKLDYLVHGLTSEAGEVAGAMKKYVRGDYDKDELVRRVRKETGDVLWYIGRIFDDLGLDMDLEAEILLAHLLDRDNKGVIHGDGDER